MDYFFDKDFIFANNSDFCTMPLVLHSTSPCLNNMSVGTDCMPY